MSKRLTGVAFCLIAAILYSVNYLCTAIINANRTTWGDGTFSWTMEVFVGKAPTYWAVISLIAGIGYLIWAEIEYVRNKH